MKNPRSRGSLGDENRNRHGGSEGNLGGLVQSCPWVLKRFIGGGGKLAVRLVYELTQFDFGRSHAVVFFPGSGFGDSFTKLTGMLAVESFLKRGSDRFGFCEIANHFCPGHTLQNRQMPAGGQKQSQPDHYGGNGSKNWKPMVHESGGLVSAGWRAVNPAHPAK